MVVAWSAEGLRSLEPGALVWYRIVTKKDPSGMWLLGTLKCIKDEMVHVQTRVGRPVEHVVPMCDADAANPEILDGVPDLTALSHLNEPAILNNLEYRYGDDTIYTRAGPVLIALNPCKALPLYTPQVVAEYRDILSDMEAEKKSPHIFLNAGKAFRDMVDNNTSQSMVISGESGAGKTETTKKAMQFFAQMSGGHGIEDQVLQTNPLLEAFGNAKTLRNHNSSRFGKLLEIHFNRSNHISGAKISSYLLEKSRVVYQIPGERSFHIFYQLVRGATLAEREVWKLPSNVEKFKYLNKEGAVTTIEGVSDSADFKEVRVAMDAVGIDQDMQSKVFATVSAILWMGNITMTPVGDDATTVVKDEAFGTVCSLLGLEEDKLEFALTHRLVLVSHDQIRKPLSIGNALDTRDALAKVLYEAVFTFLVDRINMTLGTKTSLSGKFIAILDIYGFESFKNNSFEQLCINYANERLQQQFNKHLFKLEQEEYDTEGIDWSEIVFVDNQVCLDAIDARPPKGLGVMTVLDDQCNFPRSTDLSFSDTIRDRLSKTERFSYKPGPHLQFIIDHYAGPVIYDCKGFLDKNRDTVSVDLVTVLQSSTAWLVQQVLPTVAGLLEGKSKQTVSSRFKEQLVDLVTRLDSTQMHFARCIKPNFGLKPDTFDQAMILQQLRCCGVLEVVRIAKAGYPTRYLFKDFATRYQQLLPGSPPTKGNNWAATCTQILDHFRVPENMYQAGYTKIFFRAGVLGQMEDLWRRTQKATLVIQKNIRMILARKSYQRKRAGVTTISAYWKGYRQRKVFSRDLKQHRAAIIIQTHVRRLLAKRSAKRRAFAIVTFQCAWQWKRVCKRVRQREKDMREQLQFAVERLARSALEIEDKDSKLRRQTEELQELNAWRQLETLFGMSSDDVKDALTERQDLVAEALEHYGTAVTARQLITAANEEAAAAKEQLANIREECSSLQALVDTSRAEIDPALEEASTARERAAVCKGEADTATEEAAALRVQADSANEQAAEAAQEVAALRLQVESAEQRAAAAVEEVASLRLEVDSAKEQAAEATEEAAALRLEAEAAGEQAAALQIQIDAASVTAKALQVQVDAAMMEADTLKQQSEVTAAQLKLSREEASLAKDDAAAAIAEATTLYAKVSAAKHEAADAIEAAAVAQQEAAALRSEAATVKPASSEMTNSDREDLEVWREHRDAFASWQTAERIQKSMSPDGDGVVNQRELLKIAEFRAAEPAFRAWQAQMSRGDGLTTHTSGAMSQHEMTMLTTNSMSEYQHDDDTASQSSKVNGKVQEAKDKLMALKLQLEDEMDLRMKLQLEVAALRNTINTKPALVTPSRGSNGDYRTRASPSEPPHTDGSVHVANLHKDFDNRARVFEDDLSFIGEVVTGQSDARHMDPAEEMKQLKDRYDSWKVAFKMRMQQTYVLIKQYGKSKSRIPVRSQSRSAHPINESLSGPLPHSGALSLGGYPDPDQEHPRTTTSAACHAHPSSSGQHSLYESSRSHSTKVSAVKDSISGMGRAVGRVAGTVRHKISGHSGQMDRSGPLSQSPLEESLSLHSEHEYTR